MIPVSKRAHTVIRRVATTAGIVAIIAIGALSKLALLQPFEMGVLERRDFHHGSFSIVAEFEYAADSASSLA